MKLSVINIFFLTAIIFLSACKKDDFNALTDARPDIPVTVTNAVEYRPGPTVSVSRGTDNFTIALEIPLSKGRTIKEISKVVASTGSSTALFGTANLYNAAPIAGNNSNKIIFSTSLTEYKSKFGNNSVPANNPPINAVELTRQFYFLVKLDNGEELISTQVRVLVLP